MNSRVMMRIWDVLTVSCPSCGVLAGQRCRPSPLRSTRLETQYPHVARIRKYNSRKDENDGSRYQ